VIQLSYGKLSPDGRWFVPNAVNVKASPSCSYTATSSAYQGAATFSEWLGAHVSFSAGVNLELFRAKFSASASFQATLKQSVADGYRFAAARMQCEPYVAELAPYTVYNLTQSFRNGVASLSAEFKPTLTSRFSTLLEPTLPSAWPSAAD
jgi:hypothetical protein